LLALFDFTHFVKSSGYTAIFVLSVLQSCCVPTSSELTMGIAGVLSAERHLSLPAVIIVGAAGEVVGAYIAWFIGRTGGRAFVDRFGRYLLLSHHDLDRAEAWYERHGSWGVFASRLVPVVRNFVALPAGVAEVPLLRFGLFTAAGSLIWDGAMAVIGYEVGKRYTSVMHGVTDAGYLLGLLVVIAIAVFLVHRYRSYKAATATGGPAEAAASARAAAARSARAGITGAGSAGAGSTGDGAPGTSPGAPQDNLDAGPTPEGTPGGDAAGDLSPRPQP
jgi:membrane protein DedA with SNARE-associated domain